MFLCCGGRKKLKSKNIESEYSVNQGTYEYCGDYEDVLEEFGGEDEQRKQNFDIRSIRIRLNSSPPPSDPLDEYSCSKGDQMDMYPVYLPQLHLSKDKSREIMFQEQYGVDDFSEENVKFSGENIKNSLIDGLNSRHLGILDTYLSQKMEYNNPFTKSLELNCDKSQIFKMKSEKEVKYCEALPFDDRMYSLDMHKEQELRLTLRYITSKSREKTGNNEKVYPLFMMFMTNFDIIERLRKFLDIEDIITLLLSYKKSILVYSPHIYRSIITVFLENRVQEISKFDLNLESLTIDSQQNTKREYLIYHSKSLSPKFWDLISRFDYDSFKSKFDSALSKPTKYSQIIELDANRTFNCLYQSDTYYTTLKQVLSAISNSISRIGYVQGLNSMVASILNHILSPLKIQGEIIDNSYVPHLAYWMTLMVLKKYNFRLIYANKFQGYRLLCWQFHLLLEFNLPKIYLKFKEVNFDLNLVATQWFLTLYTNILEDSIMNKIFHLFLVKGYKVVLQIALAILELSSDDIHRLEDDDMFIYFSKRQYKENFNCETLLKKIEKFEIPCLILMETETLFLQTIRQFSTVEHVQKYLRKFKLKGDLENLNYLGIVKRKSKQQVSWMSPRIIEISIL